MTKREAVRNAIQNIEGDIVPYNIEFTWQAKERTAAYLQDPDFVGKIGNHLSYAGFSGFSGQEIAPGYFQDDFGVVWNRTGADKEIGVIDNPLIQEPDMRTYTFPEVPEAQLRQDFEEMMQSGLDTFHLANLGFSMFERAWTLRGMENFLADMIAEPEFAHDLLDSICDFNMKIIDIALDYDIDAVHFGDDWGQQKGLIMGPRLWREFIKPRMAKMFERVRNAGKYVSLHSCGDIEDVFSDLIDIGLNVYQTFQPEIYDITAVKKTYGKNLTFWGGISTQQLLPFATPDELRKEVAKIFAVMKPGGGYIAAPTHEVAFDVPPENIKVLIDIFQSQGTAS